MSHDLGGLRNKKQPVPRMSIIYDTNSGFGSPINSFSVDSNLSQISVKSFSKISSSLLSPTGSAINRRKSFGIVDTRVSKVTGLSLPSKFDFEPGKNSACTPKFMHGTSSTRGRRASCSIPSPETAISNLYSADSKSALNISQLKSMSHYPDEDAMNMSIRLFAAGVQAAPLKELNEDPRYGIWHPRYRMPMGIFGFSKPFLHAPDMKKKQSKRKYSA